MGTQQKSVFDPAIERPLLALHRALGVDSFWKAAQQLLAIAIPNHLVRLTLQHAPVLPRIVKWTRPLPNGFFATEPLKSRIAARPQPKIVRLNDIFPNRRSLTSSHLYRRYLETQGCRHGVVLLFWQKHRLICGITILRTAAQGNLSGAEMRLLRHLYPQFLTALQRLGSVEREHSMRTAFEEFVRRLPLPTMLLRWNLKLIYQNQAARDFCAVWEKGPEDARLTNAHSPVPPEILERCRELKQEWTRINTRRSTPTGNREGHVHHPRMPHLRAAIRLRQLTSAGVARPHFLIECKDLRQSPASPAVRPTSRLQYFVPLTSREREVVRLVCKGQSNQEIADEAGLSVPTVKQHVHAIFRKLEVSSRSRLIALLR